MRGGGAKAARERAEVELVNVIVGVAPVEDKRTLCQLSSKRLDCASCPLSA